MELEEHLAGDNLWRRISCLGMYKLGLFIVQSRGNGSDVDPVLAEFRIKGSDNSGTIKDIWILLNEYSRYFASLFCLHTFGVRRSL